mmetsp:Transcript_9923/g.18103  ORF Transcript_9923/g.18103 Transcript_9923/m.18103 type:complete len:357 (-) Transcript_9923:417-1487(-)|eukprot:CAMPEP_0196142388 /NCGR_PEP_ID=MMETSP0910-20130528/11580_1 /TAXON_ID=49265 /ORGANISM="Thalassiosira rotula, Strain GSO102" /LENGTH=356 /DNA_ID=CAMNT_0041403691 /DNA_START=117 /DNA_END=1187 /DNA_ORIENTATION=+
MNPLLSFWMKVQPLTNSFGAHTWKAISQSSAIASSSGDDSTVQRTTTSSSWAFDYLNILASQVFQASSSWFLNPMISRMQDAPILKPTSRALCEGFQRYPTRKEAPHGVGVRKRLTKHSRSSNSRSETSPPTSSLLQSQQMLQQQDYIDYGIAPPSLVRRNSKDWVREYKKERIDKINYNNVFGGMSDASSNDLPTLPPPAADDDAMDMASSSRENPNYLLHPNSPSTSTTSSTTAVPDTVASLSLPHSTPPNIISNKPIDSLSPGDVICGRGGKANTHPGNISFREEAKKLRSWYESSSKSEKFTISSFLVDVVRERGGRFLKRDPERSGKWLDADASDVRKKASQALREGRRNQ